MLKLFSALVKSGGAGVAGLLFGLVANKIMAVTLGPTGIGVLAMYRQIHDTATGLGIFGAGAGQIQALSAVEGKARRRRVVTSIWLSLSGAMLAGITLLAAAPMIANHVFREPSAEIVFAVRCLAFTVSIAIVSITLQGLINVSRAIGRLAIVQVLGSIVLALVAWPFACAAAAGSQLAFIGIVAMPVLAQFVAAGWYIHRLGWTEPVLDALRRRPAREDMVHQLRFFTAGLITGVLSAISFVAVRALLVERGGQELHGLFQAAWTLSLQNVGLLLSAASTYLLPTMARASDPNSRNTVLNDAVELLALCSIPLVGGAMLFQPLILELLFSSRFTAAIDTLSWMLVGNYFRVFQFLYYALVVSAARVKVMVAIEVSWYAGFVLLVYIAMSPSAPDWMVGLRGVGLAVAIVQFVSMAGGAWYARRWLGVRLSRRVQVVWAGGLAIVLACAAVTWHAHVTDWAVSVPMAVATVVASILLAGPRRWADVREALRRRTASTE